MKQVDILQIEDSWYSLLKDYFESPYFSATMKALKEELGWQPSIDVKLSNLLPHNLKYDTRTTPGKQIYPYFTDIFNAYNTTSFEKVKVVIIGQNPYHGPNQAHGLAFSVQEGCKIPPSLQNIFKELDSDLGKSIPEHGDLTRWAEQGVLLLNTSLTVREGQPNSHLDIGWNILTDVTIQRISQFSESGIVFILWGKHAQKCKRLIDQSKHYILEAAHPSPFSAYTGFFGCKHFYKTNQILESQNKSIINW
jgi:uracil-DNA glycosylase